MTFDTDELLRMRERLFTQADANFGLLPTHEQELLLHSNLIEGEGVYQADMLGQILAWYRLRPEALAGHTLTRELVVAAHRHLMTGKLIDYETGRYRRVRIGMMKNDEWQNIFAPARDVPRLMRAWIDSFNSAELSSWELHQGFLNIHPFTDGNGRMARLMWGYDLLRRGEIAVSPLRMFMTESEGGSVTTVFRNARLEYYRRLEDGNVDWPGRRHTKRLPVNAVAYA